MKYSILLFTLWLWNASVCGQKATLTVYISEIPSEQGDIKLALFDASGKEAFVYKPDKAFRKSLGTIQNGKSEAHFKNIPYGQYALSVFHDENSDNELNRAPAGYPTEAYGFSNNPKGLGIPEYKLAEFEVNQGKQEIYIVLKKFDL